MHQDQETLGRYLRRERESHRVPVEEIALFVRVNRSFIDALEGDDFDAFPRRSACVRLVKQYAAYLKLNQPEVLRLFEAQWKLAGEVKRYPKLTQFADGDPSPAGASLFTMKRLHTGQLPARRVWLPVLVGTLIVGSVLFIELPDMSRDAATPDPRPTSETTIDVSPVRDRSGSPPAADSPRRTASLKQVSRPETPHPGSAVAERKVPPSPQGVRVIGNRDSKRYHLPGMKFYDQVKAYHRVVFQSEKEAIRSGYRKARE